MTQTQPAAAWEEELDADEAALVDGQYRDRKSLRPILDQVVSIARERHPDVEIDPCEDDVALLTPQRRFAVVRPSTKSRVDLGLRLDDVAPQGRLEEASHFDQETINLEVGLPSPDAVDEEVESLITNAWNRNV